MTASRVAPEVSREEDLPFLWDDLEWTAFPHPLQFSPEMNAHCLTLNTIILNDSLPIITGDFIGRLRARAIRWCVYRRDDELENSVFRSLMRAFVGRNCPLLEFYFDADRSVPLFWSQERIQDILHMLRRPQSIGSCLQLLSLNGLFPTDFEVDEWSRFLQLIEDHPSLRRVELQGCPCEPSAAGEWIRPLQEMGKRTRFRPRPLEILFLGRDDDAMAARFWQVQYCTISDTVIVSGVCLVTVHWHRRQ